LFPYRKISLQKKGVKIWFGERRLLLFDPFFKVIHNGSAYFEEDHMGAYIFITTEGFTYQPGSKAAEPDIENCQVLGFAKADDEDAAFKALLEENSYLLETSFDEVVCLGLKDEDYRERKRYFYLKDKIVSLIKNCD
jgi:hypothetical protein